MTVSVVVVAVVAALVFFYVRSTRRARSAWLRKLDLPGTWRWPEGSCELELEGALDSGRYKLSGPNGVERGSWLLQGQQLTFTHSGGERQLALHFFQPGSIGLETPSGQRELYAKVADNVVPLRRG